MPYTPLPSPPTIAQLSTGPSDDDAHIPSHPSAVASAASGSSAETGTARARAATAPPAIIPTPHTVSTAPKASGLAPSVPVMNATSIGAIPATNTV